MKNQLHIIVGLFITTIMTARDLPMERSSKATPESKKLSWTFEIKNKMPQHVLMIQLLDKQGNQVLDVPVQIGRAKGKDEKDQGYLRIANLNPSAEYTLFVKPLFTGTLKKDAEYDTSEQTAPSKFKILENPKRQRVFLSVENTSAYNKPSFALRPQKGKGTGLVSKKSQSGIELANNIKASEIQLVPFENYEYKYIAG